MDLVSIGYQFRVKGLNDEEVKREVSKIIHEKIKQMTNTEFLQCFASASFDIRTMNNVITLIFPTVSDEQ